MKIVTETPYLPIRGLPPWLLNLAVVFLVCGYCAGIGLMAGSERWTITALLIAAPVAVIGAALVGHYFQMVVLLLPLSALILPIAEIGTGSETRLPLSLLLTLALGGLWIAAMYRRGWKIVASPLNAPLVVFAAICTISLFWGIIWRDPILLPWSGTSFVVVQIASLVTILASLGAGLLIGNFVTTRRQVGWVLGCFTVVGVLMTFSQMLGLNQSVLNDRGLWGLWHTAAVVGLLVAQPKIRWYWRAALLLALGLNLYHTMIVNSLWVSGWLPSVTGVAAVVFFASRRLFFSLLLVVALVAGQPLFAYITEVNDANVEEGSLQRLTLWEQNWRVVSDHWLFGTGPAGYAIYYMTFFRADARSTHNNYLDILAQFGFTGLFVWFWLAIVAVWEGWRLISRAPPGILRTAAIVATGGWIAALGSMMLGDWVLPFAFNQGIGGFKYTVYTWLFLGLLISIRRIIADEEREAEEEADAIREADFANAATAGGSVDAAIR
ncbi:MAG: O-antigen ligase domain-containing protein [Oscillochloris sp.]|nr:O-antigen ligase domain-containing protein [Oscillochloris sp.]